MASRSSGTPFDGAYPVCPASIASFPACLTFSGVSKSGSPTERSTTSTPSASSSLARLLTARVALGSTLVTLLLNLILKCLRETDRALDCICALLYALPGLRARHPRPRHAERHGRVAVEAHVRELLGRGARDDLVVVRVAGDDGADDGDGVHVLASRQPVGGQRRVVRPRYVGRLNE